MISYKFKPFIMRKLLLLLFSASFLLACNNNKSDDKKDSSGVAEKKDSNAFNGTQQTAAPTPAAIPNPYEKLLGSFVGAFGKNKITMLITKVTKDSVGGRM